jgi:hypothetical protein
MFGEEVAAAGGKRLWVFISSSPGVVVLRLNGHLLIDDFEPPPHGEGGADLQHWVVESLGGGTVTSPLKDRWVLLSLLLLLLAEECVRWK